MTLGFLAFLSSCKKGKSDPSIEDQVLNYEIPITPPTRDYILGAFYTNMSGFSQNIVEKPVVGPYFMNNGVLTSVSDPASSGLIMEKHIEFAKKSKLNYFIFPVRSANLDFNGYRTDSVLVNSFLNAANSADMSFALSYNLDAGKLGVSSTVPIENNGTLLESFYKDFQRMAFYFGKTNYMKVNGKTLVIINNAQNLNANNNPAIYAEIRKRLSALGFELYIVGMQDRWSPPARFYFRFQNCVDAMYEYNMIDTRDYDRYYLFLQNVDTGWKYWKELLATWNVEFIPSISPAFNSKISSPTSTNPNISRTADGLFYRKFCNVAKRNATASGLVFIDSFNNWTSDTQIEPAESYGELYLDITRQEFKMGN